MIFYCDTPFFNKYFFQEPATPIMEGIVDLHNYICVFLIFILVFVTWILVAILYRFIPSKRFHFSRLPLTFIDVVPSHILGFFVFFFKHLDLLLFRIFSILEKSYFDALAKKFEELTLLQKIDFIISILFLYYKFFIYRFIWIFDLYYVDNFYNVKLCRSFNQKFMVPSELEVLAMVLYDKHLEYMFRYCYRYLQFSKVYFLSFKKDSFEKSFFSIANYPHFRSLYVNTYTMYMKFSHGTILEIVWTITPSIILVFIAIPSFALLYSIDEVIDPSVTLKVIGHQWYWSYEYSDYVTNNRESLIFDSYMINEDDLSEGQLRLLEVDNIVVLPVNTHIRVLVTSADVIHSWAIPSLGVKVDAIPGRLNQFSLFIKREGIFYGQCSEICGVNHGFMPIVIKAVDMGSYCSWLNSSYN